MDATEKGIADTRNDILSRLLQATDANGQQMGRTELIAEALTKLIAGSDTISDTPYAVFHRSLHGERSAPVQTVPQLQQELDEAVEPIGGIASYARVKDLPFLRRCIDEGMRLHSTSATGLPGLVADNGGVSNLMVTPSHLEWCFRCLNIRFIIYRESGETTSRRLGRIGG